MIAEERRLAERAAAGDRDALSSLYDEYSEQLFAVAYRLTGSSADAADVLHEVFSRLPETLQSFDRGRSLPPWLRTVTTRAALEQLRRERQRCEAPLPDGLEDETLRTPWVLDFIVLERALSSLPEDLRQVIVLKAMLGYSHEEIGKLLGIRPATSRGRLYRARAALHAQLGGR